jgi:hypothetical protein
MGCCTVYVLIIEKAAGRYIDGCKSCEVKTIVGSNRRLSIGCGDVVKLACQRLFVVCERSTYGQHNGLVVLCWGRCLPVEAVDRKTILVE